MSELGIRSTARPWEAATERGRAVLERFPGIYVRIARHRTPERDGLDAATDLLIEGFPRSGNSFLVSWIATANPDLRIASHMHSMAHVHAALRRDLPVVIVVREPEDALASLAVFSPEQPLEQHIERYRRFHERAIDVTDDVIVSPFEVTTKRPELVVDALRPRMSQDLVASPPGGTVEVMEAVDRRSLRFHGSFDPNVVSRPSDTRSRATESARTMLRAHHGEALARLQSLHDRLTTGPTALKTG